MAASFDVGNTPKLYQCKKCRSVLKDAVMLSCGHRVCGDQCLDTQAGARCPVSTCGDTINQEKVTIDDVIRKAVALMIKAPQIDNQTRNYGISSELQPSNVYVLTDSDNISVLQESIESLQRDLTLLAEELADIKEMLRSTRLSLSQVQSDVSGLSERTQHEECDEAHCLTEDNSRLSNDVRQLKEEMKRIYRCVMLNMASTGEESIKQRRSTEDTLQQYRLDISRNSDQIREALSQIQDLHEYNRQQQRVVRPAYLPRQT